MVIYSIRPVHDFFKSVERKTVVGYQLSTASKTNKQRTRRSKFTGEESMPMCTKEWIKLN